MMTKPRTSNILGHERCESYLVFAFEAAMGENLRAFLYFKSMETVVKQTRTVLETDPWTNAEVVVRTEKVWNYTIADISLLAFGTSFPQISLATIDAIRNLGQLDAGGLGPGTLVGSAAFDLFPIHAVCVVVPKAGELKKIADIGVWLVELFWSFWAYAWLYIILEVWTPNVITLWEALLTVLQYGLLLLHAYAQDKRWPYLSLPLGRSERPEEWVPAETSDHMHGKKVLHNTIEIVVADGDSSVADIFSIHSESGTGPTYQRLPSSDADQSSTVQDEDGLVAEESRVLAIWRQQFTDAIKLETMKKKNGQLFPPACKDLLAVATVTMEILLCFRTSLSDREWMGSLHWFSNFHQWNRVYCYQAHRYDQLRDRNKRLCHSIHSIGRWNLVA